MPNDKSRISGMIHEHKSAGERGEEQNLWPSFRKLKRQRKAAKYTADWQISFGTALAKVNELVNAAKQHLARIIVLEREVNSIRSVCKELTAGQSILVPITTLAPEPYDVITDIKAVVQPDEDSFVATFFDANVNASGETQQDAIANLKDMIVMIFETLEKEPRLGVGPTRQLHVLRNFMRRKE